MKPDWSPSWEVERRQPTFVGGGVAEGFGFKHQKYLWGNMPALDILALDKNEGNFYDRDVHVLFAGKMVPSI